MSAYFAPDDARLAVSGCCHDFALALSRMTGWRLAVLQRLPAGDGFDLSDCPVPVHVFCVTPDGLAVDAEGAGDPAALMRRWDTGRGRWFSTEEFEDEAAYAAAMAGGPLAPREHGTQAAARLIAASPAYLALVEGLRAGGASAAPRP